MLLDLALAVVHHLTMFGLASVLVVEMMMLRLNMMLWTAPPPASEGATVRCLRNREEGAIHERRYHHRN